MPVGSYRRPTMGWRCATGCCWCRGTLGCAACWAIRHRRPAPPGACQAARWCTRSAWRFRSIWSGLIVGVASSGCDPACRRVGWLVTGALPKSWSWRRVRWPRWDGRLVMWWFETATMRGADPHPPASSPLAGKVRRSCHATRSGAPNLVSLRFVLRPPAARGSCCGNPPQRARVWQQVIRLAGPLVDNPSCSQPCQKHGFGAFVSTSSARVDGPAPDGLCVRVEPSRGWQGAGRALGRVQVGCRGPRVAGTRRSSRYAPV